MNIDMFEDYSISTSKNLSTILVPILNVKITEVQESGTDITNFPCVIKSDNFYIIKSNINICQKLYQFLTIVTSICIFGLKLCYLIINNIHITNRGI